jgi:hypothetical protein
MTVYEGIATHLVSNQTALQNTFYPLQAPQKTSKPYCVFKLVDDSPLTTHDGNYKNGIIIIQFDLYADSLSVLDDRAKKLKDHFIAKSKTINSDISICYTNSQNEFDGFDDQEQLYLRSFDLRMTYIKN